jgi:DNA gyrase/topoisomerase IV subunit A
LLAENYVSQLKEDVNFVVGVSSERGIVYSIRAYQIPECSRTAAGNPLVQV